MTTKAKPQDGPEIEQPQEETPEEAPETEEKDIHEQIRRAAGSIKRWAEEKGVPFEAVLDAYRDDTDLGDEHSMPPSHRTVCWTDIHAPSGLKVHVTAREGATPDMIKTTILAIAGACHDLMESGGYLSGDRRPKTQAEIDETRDKLAGQQGELAKLDERYQEAPMDAPKTTRKTVKRVGGNGATVREPKDSYESIEVENVRKMETDNGNLFYLMKGFPYKKFGVKAWPDSGRIAQLAGVVDLQDWAMKETIDFQGSDIFAVVRMKPGGEQPDRVIGWQGPGVIAQDETAE